MGWREVMIAGLHPAIPTAASTYLKRGIVQADRHHTGYSPRLALDARNWCYRSILIDARERSWKYAFEGLVVELARRVTNERVK